MLSLRLLSKGKNLSKNNLKNYRSFGTLPPFLLNRPTTQVTTLPNGMRVATEETPVETATVGVFIDAGSAYENEKNNGVAHFLEHMAFKGTSSRSREALEREVENIGGSLNAYTSRELTAYYARVFKKDVPQAVDILSDILQNSSFEKGAIESERGTILREMEEVSKDYHEVIFDHLHSTAYQGTGLGRTILGSPENVKSITRNDLVQYIQSHYVAPRMVLAAAGGIKHEEVVSIAQKLFSGIPAGNPSAQKTEKPTTTTKKSLFSGSQLTIRDDLMDTAHVAIAVEGVGWSHPDYFTFMVLQTIVGNWDRTIGGGKNLSSRLCELIATEKIANTFNSFYTCYHDTSLFGAYAEVPSETADDLVYETLGEWVRLGRDASKSEVERAKLKLKSSLLMQLDGTTPIAEDIGRQILNYGRRLSPAEIFLRIDAVTPADVMRVARQYCEDVCPAVAAVGGLWKFPDYNYVRSYTVKNRW